jgi:hypothetical protein
MNLLKWFKKPTQLDIKREKYLKGVDENKYTFYELYTPELLEWIANTNDPILLACASHLINCWDWPNYLPKPRPEYDIVGHGWNNGDYKSVLFTQKLMEQLDKKAEMISPELSQTLWVTGYYRKFSTKAEINNVQPGDDM